MAERPREFDPRTAAMRSGICPHCQQSVRATALNQSWIRCEACGFIQTLPGMPHNPLYVAEQLELRELAPQLIFREKYRILSVLGRSIHGLTLLAMHEFMNYSCVIKLIHRGEKECDDPAIKTLRAEAAAGERVRHSNVVRVLEADLDEATPYFVMEYIEGADLGRILQSGVVMDWRQVFDIAVSAAEALAAIHDAGLLHRDIKPANLLLGADGQVRVADLGIAAAAGNGRLSADLHALAGTAPYAAPELFEAGATVDQRADVYSLGATLYQMLTGSLVGGPQGALRRLLGESTALRWPAQLELDSPTWFRQTIERMVAVCARDRPADMPEVLSNLRRRQTRAAPRILDQLAPRGVVVLPFHDVSKNAAEGWLGFAIADALARRIGETPGTFVASTEQFQQQLMRRDAAGESREMRLLAAGRIVGADRVIEGAYERIDDTITVRASMLSHDSPEPYLIAAVAGPLDAITDLQRSLFEAVLEALHLAPAPPVALQSPPRRTVALAAQEKATLGRQAYLRGEYARAIRFAEEALELDPQVVEPLSYIGACHARLGNYAESEAYHRQLEALALERSEKRLLVESHANLGVMHYFRGDYEMSVRMQLSAARIAEELLMSAELAFIYNNLGFAQFRLGRADQAETAFRRAIEIHSRFGALGALIAPYNGLGNVLVEDGRYAEARQYYSEALALAEEIGDRTNVGLTHLHIGRAATLEARYGDAKRELAIALTVFGESNFWNGLMRAHEYIADLNVKLGDHAEALRCTDQRIVLARRYGNARLESAALRQKADVLRASGKMAEAAAIQELATECERAHGAAPVI